MKELLVYTADADAEAVFRALLRRSSDLGLPPINADVDRHFAHDAGLYTTGPALCRHRKPDYRHVLLVLDHHGCGREHARQPETVGANLQRRLDGHSWAERSAVVVIAPELEVLLWRDADAIAGYYGVEPAVLAAWVGEFGSRPESAPLEQPKELLEYVVRDRLRRTLSPADFAAIAGAADLSRWSTDPAFDAAVAALRCWFVAAPDL